jgi:uncharacterized protein YifE (UPF0438 family)
MSTDQGWQTIYRQYLGKPFECLCHESSLSFSELSQLQKYGAWMLALATGELAPKSAAQEQFCRFSRREQPPQTQFEQLWIDCLLQCDIDHRPRFQVFDPGDEWFPRDQIGHVSR